MFAAYRRWRHDSDNPRVQGKTGRIDTMITAAIQANGGQSAVDDRERFRGCLLGGAVGDALGGAVELIHLSEIIRRYGPSGIQGYAKSFGREGAITDETQMTLFTAEGLIRGLVQERHEGRAAYGAVIANAYQRWLLTQGEKNSHGIDPLVPEPGWLYSNTELHAQRGPGKTCRGALREASELGAPASNNRTGCSGVMRVAPVGLFAASMSQSFALGCEVAALTHGKPAAWLSGGALAVMITALRQGAGLPEAINTALLRIAGCPGHEKITGALTKAVKHAQAGSDSDVAIAQLGEGWIAEEALAIATYCALVAPDFRQGIIMAVNHDGDSDATGAMAGNLLGMIGGVSGIPVPWLDGLELRRVIEAVADDLHDCQDWRIGRGAEDSEFDDKVWARYPGY